MARKKPELFLRFSASQQQPDFLGIFLENGGSLDAAATAWETDFSLTASTEATFDKLDRYKTKEIKMRMPPEMYEVEGDTVFIKPHTRLNMSTSRIGTAINGTLVSSIAGQGSEFLYWLLRPDRSHSQVGLVYASWLQHTASVGISEVEIFNGSTGETCKSISFEGDDTDKGRPQQLLHASHVVEKYWESAWMARQVMRYSPSPMLTKTVFKDTVGVAGKGYAMLHDVVQRDQPYSLQCLEDMYRVAVRAVLGGDKERLAEFTSLSGPGSATAAKHAETVVSATSLVVNFLVMYRSDGANKVSVAGVDFAGAESWLWQTQRTAEDGNDCDGSALLAIGILNAITHGNSAEEIAKHPHLNTVRNTLNPFYQVALAIVGATASEATSAGESATVAGHAIAVVLPTLSILRGLHKGSQATIGSEKKKQRVVNEKDAGPLAEVRFAAMFPQSVQKGLPEEDKQMLKVWEEGDDTAGASTFLLEELKALAVEGTTPSSSTLFIKDSKERTEFTKFSAAENHAISKLSPSVMRSMKSLHVGGSNSGCTHMFYRDIVELTFPRTHPLWSDKDMRSNGAAASQYVLARKMGEHNHVSSVGVTPKDLELEEFIVIPLISVLGPTAELLDYASAEAYMDVVAPRPKSGMALDQFRLERLNESFAALQQLSEHLQQLGESGDGNGGAVGSGVQRTRHIASFSTLLNNADGIAQFCRTAQRIATGGFVEGLEKEGGVIRDLARDPGDHDVGRFVVVSIDVPV